VQAIAEEHWRAATDGNLFATFLINKSFLPGMKSRGNGNSSRFRRPRHAGPGLDHGPGARPRRRRVMN